MAGLLQRPDTKVIIAFWLFGEFFKDTQDMNHIWISGKKKKEHTLTWNMVLFTQKRPDK